MSDAPELRFLSADELLNVDDRPVASLEVQEWGGSIRVRALALGDYLSLKEQHTRPDGEADERELSIAMLQAGIVDEQGEPMLTLEQARQLLRKNAVPLGRVMKAIGQVTGTDDVAKEAEATFHARTEP